ncbi:MAG TPA: FAD-dependent oxidoreductase [Bryobacteraceae bacterium]|jgi:sarcosine oxidase subunit beta|nr:FAD-dependent oxidoreductase [Bryobacteraceae bacterium]
MLKSADVVIVGGGIVGSSIAYQLTLAGCRNVVILERESSQGKGSTGKSMGGVRAQFSTTESIRMSLYSIPFFRDFEQTMGHPSGYRAQGYLFVATAQRHLDYLRTNFEKQVAAGLTTASLVSRDDIVRMVPQLRSDDIIGGSFCSTDGFVDPYSVMTGFTLRAVDQGATLIRDAEVVGLTLDAKGIVSVETAQVSIATRTVVNAGGAWSAQIAKMAGVDLPVEPLRRMLVPTEPFDKVAHSAPMTVDMSTGFHFRPEGLGLLMAWNDPDEKPGYKTNFDRGFIEKILTHAVNRVPVFEELEVNPSRAWAGLYEMTPDHHPVLGASPVGGLYFANGFSGHGVMHSPATGKILADLVLKGSTDLIDAKLLDYARFAEGRQIEETAVL